MRDARIPITPWCHSGSNRHKPYGIDSSGKSLSWARASRCMPCSMDLRSWFMPSSCAAISRAAAKSVVSRHSMPRLISSRRPAALSRGPRIKPRSVEVMRAWSRLATSRIALIPGRARPARMRSRPWWTRMRLLASNGTTSATLPRATRSSNSPRFGCCLFSYHPKPGQRLAGKLTARLVGVDDSVRRRQFIPRQVVVGHQHFEPRRLRCRHAFDAGDAVIHGDQQLRLALQGHGDDFRRQAVAEFKAVGHQVIDMGRTEQAQAQGAHRTGGGAIGVEVADDKDALALLQGRHQQVYRRVDALELLIRDQPRQALVQFGLRLYPARGVEAGQQRWQFTEKRQDSGQRAGIDTHGTLGNSL